MKGNPRCRFEHRDAQCLHDQNHDGDHKLIVWEDGQPYVLAVPQTTVPPSHKDAKEQQ